MHARETADSLSGEWWKGRKENSEKHGRNKTGDVKSDLVEMTFTSRRVLHGSVDASDLLLQGPTFLDPEVYKAKAGNSE